MKWENFKYRNLWQHPLWGDFQRAVGRRVFTLEHPGARAQVIRHSLPFGMCWLEVPRGPLFKTSEDLQVITNTLVELGKKEKAIFIRMSAYRSLEALEKKTRTAHSDYHPDTSLVLDLTQNEETLLKEMKQKGRYNIKVAEKSYVTVEASADVNDFYPMLAQTARRDGFRIHPKEYYITQLGVFGEKAQLLLAKYQGHVLAGGLFVYLDDWAIYYYGASDHHYRKYMAAYLIQWEAIREAKRRGCRFYDFLGIAPEGTVKHRWAGVTDFKRKFGGKTVSYPPAREIVLNRLRYFLYRIYKRVR